MVITRHGICTGDEGSEAVLSTLNDVVWPGDYWLRGTTAISRTRRPDEGSEEQAAIAIEVRQEHPARGQPPAADIFHTELSFKNGGRVYARISEGYNFREYSKDVRVVSSLISKGKIWSAQRSRILRFSLFHSITVCLALPDCSVSCQLSATFQTSDCISAEQGPTSFILAPIRRSAISTI